MEKGFYLAGSYYNKLFENEHQNEKEAIYSAVSADFLISTCKNYSRSLEIGTKYIYQTLPRMTTLWLDYGSGKKRQDRNIYKITIVLRRVSQSSRRLMN